MSDAALTGLTIAKKYRVGAPGIYLAADIREAILAERERCAKIVERGDCDSLEHVARVIRDDT